MTRIELIRAIEAVRDRILRKETTVDDALTLTRALEAFEANVATAASILASKGGSTMSQARLDALAKARATPCAPGKKRGRPPKSDKATS